MNVKDCKFPGVNPGFGKPRVCFGLLGAVAAVSACGGTGGGVVGGLNSPSFRLGTRVTPGAEVEIDVARSFDNADGVGVVFSAVVVRDGVRVELSDVGLEIDPRTGVITGASFSGTGEEVIEVSLSRGGGEPELILFPLSRNSPPVVDEAALPTPGSVLRGSEIEDISAGAAFSDPDAGDALTYRATVGDGGDPLSLIGLEIDSGTGVVSGTITGAGEREVHVTASDGNGGEVTASFTISVETFAGRGEVRIETEDAFALPAGGARTFSAVALRDGGPAPLSELGLEIDSATGVITGDQFTGMGKERIEVTASNGAGSATMIFIITDNAVPSVSEANFPSPGLLQRFAVVDGIEAQRAFDHFGEDELTYSATVGDHGLPLRVLGLEINPQSGAISGIVTSTGEREIHVTATDRDGDSATGSFTLSVNQNPAERGSGLEDEVEVVIGEELEAIDVHRAYRDRDNDTLSFEVAGLEGTGLSYGEDSGMITGIVQAPRSFSVTVTVTDGRGGESVKTFDVEAVRPEDATEPDNETPVWETALPARVSMIGGMVDIPVSYAFADPDEDTLTFDAMVVSGGGRRPLSDIGLMIDSDTGVIRGRFTGTGEVMIEVTASDGKENGEAVGTFGISPASTPNEAPLADPSVSDPMDTVTFDRENDIDTERLFMDPDGDVLTYSAVLEGGAGLDTVGLEIDQETGKIRGTYTGREDLTVEVTASDGRGGSHTRDLRLEENMAPMESRTLEPLSLWTGTSVIVESGYFTDPDGDSSRLTYSATLANEDGDSLEPLPSIGLWRRFTGEEGGLLYGVFESDGDVIIKVTAEDERGAESFQLFEVNLKAPLSAAAVPGGAFSFDLPEDALAEGNWGNFTAVLDTGESLESVGLEIDGRTGSISGVFTGTGAVEIDARAEDGDDMAGVSIRVELARNGAGNANPTAVDPIDRVATAGVDLDIDVSGVFRDSDPGDTLTFGATVGDNGAALSTIGLSIDRETGSISGIFESEKDAATINVTAFDGRGGLVTKSFEITQNKLIPDQIAEVGGDWNLTIPVDAFRSHLPGGEPTFTAVYFAADGSTVPVGGSTVPVVGTESPEVPFSLNNGVLAFGGGASHAGHDLELRVTGSADGRSVSTNFEVRVPHQTAAPTSSPYWMLGADEYGIGFDADNILNPINGVHSLLDSDADYFFVDRSPITFGSIGWESSWQGNAAHGEPTRLTYSFVEQGGEVRRSAEDTFRATAEFSDPQKDFIRDAFSHVAGIANVELVEMPDNGRAGTDIRVVLGTMRQFDTNEFTLGFAFYPGRSGQTPTEAQGHRGDVHIVSDHLSDDAYESPYGRDNSTVTHEILHALGVDHPFRGWAGPNAGSFGYHETGIWSGEKIVLPNHHGATAGGAHNTPLADTNFETIMTYNNPFSLGSFNYDGDIRFFAEREEPWELGIFDIAALQHLYGANTGTESGDTTYAFDSDTKVFQTIWDGGGTDVITHSGGRDAVIDLNPGSQSTVGFFGGTTYLLSAARISGVSGSTFASFEADEDLGGGITEILPDYPIENYVPNMVASFTPDLGSEIDAYGIDFTINVPNGQQLSRSIVLFRDFFAKADATHNLTIAHGVVIENAVGGDGDDLIIGNTADNVLTGGAGGDTFRIGWAAGADRITDFTVGEDEIEFVEGVTADDISASVVGGDFVFTGMGIELTLSGVTRSLESGTDYVFA